MATENLAPRFKRPGLKDPKLLTGLLIIVLSILGVIGVIQATNSTQPVYAASRDIKINEELTSDNTTIIQVHLGQSQDRYLPADQPLPQGLLARQALSSGELLAYSQVSDQPRQDRRLVTLLMDHYAVSHYRAGDRVDIWVSQKSETGNDYAEPSPLALEAEIHSLTAQESIIGGSGKTAVELWVSQDQVASVLGAENTDDVINLIPSQKGQG